MRRRDHAPAARVILASTSNVYGANSAHPGREDDGIDPKHAYPASKVAAEKALGDSGLNWAILRFPLRLRRSGRPSGRTAKHAVAGKWHPAKRISTIHHRDIATAIRPALDGLSDGRIVNISDEALSSIFELAALVGEKLESSVEPLETPRHLHVDASLARNLGFRPSVRTVYQAVQDELT